MVSWRRSAEAAAWNAGAAGAATGLATVSGLAAESFRPQPAQKLASDRFGLPQEGQRAASAAPQEMQNLPASGVSERQLGHSMSDP